MIQSVTVTNNLGNSIVLPLREYWQTGFLIREIEGATPDESEINYTELYATNGSIFNSARRATRNIVLHLIFAPRTVGSNPTTSIETLRQETYIWFPMRKQITLQIKTDNRNLKIDGYVESNSPSVFEEMEETEISIICNQPFFYEDHVYTSNIGLHQPYFHFPFWNYPTEESYSLSKPPIYWNPLTKNVDDSGDPVTFTYDRILFGKIVDFYQAYIYNGGDLEIGVLLTFRFNYAQALNGYLYIINTTNNIYMQIDLDTCMEIAGCTEFSALDEIVLNTRSGYKYCTFTHDGTEYNILNAMPRFTDWLTLEKGLNTIEITLDNNVDQNLISVIDAEMEVRYLYEGI